MEQRYGTRANLSLGPLGTTDALLWKTLSRQVQACQKTAQDLDGLLKSVQQDKSNFAKQAIRQFSLNLKTKDFEAIRKGSDHPVSSRLGRESSTSLEEGADDDEADKELLQCADEVLASATSLYAESVAGGSAMGKPLSQDRHIDIASWIKESERRDPITAPPTAKSSALSILSNSGHETSATSRLSISGGGPSNDFEGDSEDEDALDFAMQALDVGRTAYDRGDHHEAEAMLQEALVFVKDLSSGQRMKCNLYDLQFKPAVCTFHTKDAATAEATLLAFMQQLPQSDDVNAGEQGQNLCQSGLLLAEVQVRLGKLELAHSSAYNVLRSSRRTFGK
ncbi:hypothetical protein LTR36_010994 [Oleoguttula mirabilis]|uniref:Uncharacterized protein n=1 Tax=Oleoguttula mirabilis TaxID=1507867 RepID=A0AAV9J3A9_9PEZI|nr:hypothetical protein LTR36_010994 [Oleoguttula mirabilis]